MEIGGRCEGKSKYLLDLYLIKIFKLKYPILSKIPIINKLLFKKFFKDILNETGYYN